MRRVGTGLTDQELRDVSARLQGNLVAGSPPAGYKLCGKEVNEVALWVIDPLDPQRSVVFQVGPTNRHMMTLPTSALSSCAVLTCGWKTPCI